MNPEITKATCYEVPLENKAGTLGEVSRVFASAGVNILGIETLPAKGAVRFVVNDAPKAEAALQGKGLKFVPVPMLGLRLPNQPGALAEVTEKLGKAGVNIEGMVGYGATATSTDLLLHVPDVGKAEKVLRE